MICFSGRLMTPTLRNPVFVLITNHQSPFPCKLSDDVFLVRHLEANHRRHIRHTKYSYMEARRKKHIFSCYKHFTCIIFSPRYALLTRFKRTNFDENTNREIYTENVRGHFENYSLRACVLVIYEAEKKI